ncbi:MAG: bifunctional hydroxymethylpyrimidine kinase/phosphomethylpyrimidine kinase [Verrucomicrobiota bacterium]
MEPHFTENTPVCLTIAGSDCSAGAGIQADLKTFSAFRTFGLSALTCVVSETPREVAAVEAVSPGMLASQVSLLLRSYPVAALKTGMLFSAAHMEAVADALGDSPPPLIVDPVMIASTGDPLIEPEAVDYLAQRILPLATCLTPNLDEASHLLARPIQSRADMESACHELAVRFQTAVLLKGGHLDESEEAFDLLVSEGRRQALTAPRLTDVSTHGTGCTYSAALCAALAQGAELPEAARQAKSYLTQAIRQSHRWPNGLQALAH